MTQQTTAIVSRVWSFCSVLRDAGVSYRDYLEQLTYLIFLKMAADYLPPIFWPKISSRTSKPPWKNLRLWWRLSTGTTNSLLGPFAKGFARFFETKDPNFYAVGWRVPYQHHTGRTTKWIFREKLL